MPCPACSFQNQEGITFCGQCGIKLDSTVNMRAVHISAAIDFVDRQREMGELVSALDDAMSGQGRVVMLAGYPGIGKTRTAQEFAAIAETRNAEVFWGTATRAKAPCHIGPGSRPSDHISISRMSRVSKRRWVPAQRPSTRLCRS